MIVIAVNGFDLIFLWLSVTVLASHRVASGLTSSLWTSSPLRMQFLRVSATVILFSDVHLFVLFFSLLFFFFVCCYIF
jgi:hypothetical protein